jgi:hypothetical protein
VQPRVDLGPCQAEVDRPEAPLRVVLLPGARYSTQAPLLWFAREVALARGAGVLRVIDELPAAGDPFEWARDRARRALDLDPVQQQVVIGKSLTSAAAGLVADRGLPALWLTPLLDQPVVVDGLTRASAPTMLIGGTLDETWKPDALPRRPTVELVELPGLDHSLQRPGDPSGSLAALAEVVGVIERFLATALSV